MSEISTISMEWLSAYNTRNSSAFFPRAALSDDSYSKLKSENSNTTPAHALT